jgi:AcrR family transcriptional regulator
MASPDSKDIRTNIIKAAIECYSTQGIGQTTFSEIAKAAKVKPSHLSYYFPDFFSLMNAIVEFLRTILQSASTAAVEKNHQHPIKALHQYAIETLQLVVNKPKYFSLWMYFYHEATHRAEFAELNRLGRIAGRERISLLLYRMVENRQLELREGETIANMAYQIQAILTGYCVMVATEPDVDYKRAQALMLAQIDLSLGRPSQRR